MAVSPLQAQKKARRDPNRITLEELAEYGDQSMAEVIPRARPEFYRLPGVGGGDLVLTGVKDQLVVYIRTQMLGDTTALRYYKASDLSEVRFFKPSNALSPHTAGNAYTIQLLPKDKLKIEKDH